MSSVPMSTADQQRANLEWMAQQARLRAQRSPPPLSPPDSDPPSPESRWPSRRDESSDTNSTLDDSAPVPASPATMDPATLSRPRSARPEFAPQTQVTVQRWNESSTPLPRPKANDPVTWGTGRSSPRESPNSTSTPSLSFPAAVAARPQTNIDASGSDTDKDDRSSVPPSASDEDSEREHPRRASATSRARTRVMRTSETRDDEGPTSGEASTHNDDDDEEEGDASDADDRDTSERRRRTRAVTDPQPEGSSSDDDATIGLPTSTTHPDDPARFDPVPPQHRMPDRDRLKRPTLLRFVAHPRTIRLATTLAVRDRTRVQTSIGSLTFLRRPDTIRNLHKAATEKVEEDAQANFRNSGPSSELRHVSKFLHTTQPQKKTKTTSDVYPPSPTSSDPLEQESSDTDHSPPQRPSERVAPRRLSRTQDLPEAHAGHSRDDSSSAPSTPVSSPVSEHSLDTGAPVEERSSSPAPTDSRPRPVAARPGVTRDAQPPPDDKDDDDDYQTDSDVFSDDQGGRDDSSAVEPRRGEGPTTALARTGPSSHSLTRGATEGSNPSSSENDGDQDWARDGTQEPMPFDPARTMRSREPNRREPTMSPRPPPRIRRDASSTGSDDPRASAVQPPPGSVADHDADSLEPDEDRVVERRESSNPPASLPSPRSSSGGQRKRTDPGYGPRDERIVPRAVPSISPVPSSDDDWLPNGSDPSSRGGLSDDEFDPRPRPSHHACDREEDADADADEDRTSRPPRTRAAFVETGSQRGVDAEPDLDATDSEPPSPVSSRAPSPERIASARPPAEDAAERESSGTARRAEMQGSLDDEAADSDPSGLDASEGARRRGTMARLDEDDSDSAARRDSLEDDSDSALSTRALRRDSMEPRGRFDSAEPRDEDTHTDSEGEDRRDMIDDRDDDLEGSRSRRFARGGARQDQGSDEVQDTSQRSGATARRPRSRFDEESDKDDASPFAATSRSRVASSPDVDPSEPVDSEPSDDDASYESPAARGETGRERDPQHPSGREEGPDAVFPRKTNTVRRGNASRGDEGSYAVDEGADSDFEPSQAGRPNSASAAATSRNLSDDEVDDRDVGQRLDEHSRVEDGGFDDRAGSGADRAFDGDTQAGNSGRGGADGGARSDDPTASDLNESDDDTVSQPRATERPRGGEFDRRGNRDNDGDDAASFSDAEEPQSRRGNDSDFGNGEDRDFEGSFGGQSGRGGDRGGGDNGGGGDGGISRGGDYLRGQGDNGYDDRGSFSDAEDNQSLRGSDGAVGNRDEDKFDESFGGQGGGGGGGFAGGETAGGGGDHLGGQGDDGFDDAQRSAFGAGRRFDQDPDTSQRDSYSADRYAGGDGSFGDSQDYGGGQRGYDGDLGGGANDWSDAGGFDSFDGRDGRERFQDPLQMESRGLGGYDDQQGGYDDRSSWNELDSDPYGRDGAYKTPPDYDEGSFVSGNGWGEPTPEYLSRSRPPGRVLHRLHFHASEFEAAERRYHLSLRHLERLHDKNHTNHSLERAVLDVFVAVHALREIERREARQLTPLPTPGDLGVSSDAYHEYLTAYQDETAEALDAAHEDLRLHGSEENRRAVEIAQSNHDAALSHGHEHHTNDQETHEVLDPIGTAEEVREAAISSTNAHSGSDDGVDPLLDDHLSAVKRRHSAEILVDERRTGLQNAQASGDATDIRNARKALEDADKELHEAKEREKATKQPLDPSSDQSHEDRLNAATGVLHYHDRRIAELEPELDANPDDPRLQAKLDKHVRGRHSAAAFARHFHRTELDAARDELRRDPNDADAQRRADRAERDHADAVQREHDARTRVGQDYRHAHDVASVLHFDAQGDLARSQDRLDEVKKRHAKGTATREEVDAAHARHSAHQARHDKSQARLEHLRHKAELHHPSSDQSHEDRLNAATGVLHYHNRRIAELEPELDANPDDPRLQAKLDKHVRGRHSAAAFARHFHRTELDVARDELRRDPNDADAQRRADRAERDHADAVQREHDARTRVGQDYRHAHDVASVLHFHAQGGLARSQDRLDEVKKRHAKGTATREEVDAAHARHSAHQARHDKSQARLEHLRHKAELHHPSSDQSHEDRLNAAMGVLHYHNRRIAELEPELDANPDDPRLQAKLDKHVRGRHSAAAFARHFHRTELDVARDELRRDPNDADAQRRADRAERDHADAVQREHDARTRVGQDYRHDRDVASVLHFHAQGGLARSQERLDEVKRRHAQGTASREEVDAAHALHSAHQARHDESKARLDKMHHFHRTAPSSAFAIDPHDATSYPVAPRDVELVEKEKVHRRRFEHSQQRLTPAESTRDTAEQERLALHHHQTLSDLLQHHKSQHARLERKRSALAADVRRHHSKLSTLSTSDSRHAATRRKLEVAEEEDRRLFDKQRDHERQAIDLKRQKNEFKSQHGGLFDRRREDKRARRATKALHRAARVEAEKERVRRLKEERHALRDKAHAEEIEARQLEELEQHHRREHEAEVVKRREEKATYETLSHAREKKEHHEVVAQRRAERDRDTREKLANLKERHEREHAERRRRREAEQVEVEKKREDRKRERKAAREATRRRKEQVHRQQQTKKDDMEREKKSRRVGSGQRMVKKKGAPRVRSRDGRTLIRRR
ncbi:hypothetical protein JCM11491_005907 [Sporobolomyces phaffii]